MLTRILLGTKRSLIGNDGTLESQGCRQGTALDEEEFDQLGTTYEACPPGRPTWLLH